MDVEPDYIDPTTQPASSASSFFGGLSPAKAPAPRPEHPQLRRVMPAAAGPPVAPISGAAAVLRHGAALTPFEQSEVLEYSQVWYCGQLAAGAKVPAMRGAARNHGFDDGSGRYTYVLDDHIAYRYRLAEPLGKGAFGDCFRAFDFKRGIWVALKVIKNEPRYHRQGKIEVSVLQRLRDEDADGAGSLVHMVDQLVFRNHLCITFELLGQNLYSHIKAGAFVGLQLGWTRDIAVDLLRCLEVLARLQVVHADLKPENVLLRPAPVAVGAGPASVVKVIDFGSSCFKHGRVHTYIQSRYYRSPEVVLGLGYGCAIDMWSLGTILAELDGGHPLFPARNERDLLLLQMELLGVPPPAVLAVAKRGDEFFDSVGQPRTLVDRKGRTRPPGSRVLAEALRSGHDPMFVDFVARCLSWDPAARMTPAEALQHPWVHQGEGARLLTKAASMLSSDAGLHSAAVSSVTG